MWTAALGFRSLVLCHSLVQPWCQGNLLFPENFNSVIFSCRNVDFRWYAVAIWVEKGLDMSHNSLIYETLCHGGILMHEKDFLTYYALRCDLSRHLREV